MNTHDSVHDILRARGFTKTQGTERDTWERWDDVRGCRVHMRAHHFHNQLVVTGLLMPDAYSVVHTSARTAPDEMVELIRLAVVDTEAAVVRFEAARAGRQTVAA